jgi:hypothetical protein
VHCTHVNEGVLERLSSFSFLFTFYQLVIPLPLYLPPFNLIISVARSIFFISRGDSKAPRMYSRLPEFMCELSGIIWTFDEFGFWLMRLVFRKRHSDVHHARVRQV